MNNVTGVNTRVELAPAVASLLEQDTAQARLGRSFIRFALALLDPDSNRIDEVVTVDARFHELEAAGFPPGPNGFKLFRRQINAALPDEHTVVVSMRFPQENIVETELCVRGGGHTSRRAHGHSRYRQTRQLHGVHAQSF